MKKKKSKKKVQRIKHGAGLAREFKIYFVIFIGARTLCLGQGKNESLNRIIVNV